MIFRIILFLYEKTFIYFYFLHTNASFNNLTIFKRFVRIGMHFRLVGLTNIICWAIHVQIIQAAHRFDLFFDHPCQLRESRPLIRIFLPTVFHYFSQKIGRVFRFFHSAPILNFPYKYPAILHSYKKEVELLAADM